MTWQTDPQLQALLKAVSGVSAGGFQQNQRGQQEQATRAVQQYVEANRQRLGIPEGYTVGANNELVKSNYPWWVIPAVGGSMALGGMGLGAALGGSAAGAASGAAPVGGLAPGTVAPGVVNLATPASNAAAAAVAPGAAAGTGGGLSGLLKNLTSGANIPSMVGLGASLVGGIGGGSNNSAEADRIKAITEARMRRADPLHQMVVNLAASRMPTNVQRPVPDVPLPERK